MTNASDTRDEARPARGRPWIVAILVWLSVCCTATIVLVVNLQFFGLEHFSTAKGSSEVRDFVRSALLYPGLVLPALIIVRPRWSAVMCALLLAADLVLLVRAGLGGFALYDFPAYWLGNVLPVVLVGLATLLAYRRRDWQAYGARSPAA